MLMLLPPRLLLAAPRIVLLRCACDPLTPPHLMKTMMVQPRKTTTLNHLYEAYPAPEAHWEVEGVPYPMTVDGEDGVVHAGVRNYGVAEG